MESLNPVSAVRTNMLYHLFCYLVKILHKINLISHPLFYHWKMLTLHSFEVCISLTCFSLNSLMASEH